MKISEGFLNTLDGVLNQEFDIVRRRVNRLFKSEKSNTNKRSENLKKAAGGCFPLCASQIC